MVVKRINGQDLRRSKILDRDKISKSLEQATSFGASYAEPRLVSSNSTSMALKDGQLEKSIPANDVAATLRILADGSWEFTQLLTLIQLLTLSSPQPNLQNQ